MLTAVMLKGETIVQYHIATEVIWTFVIKWRKFEIVVFSLIRYIRQIIHILE